MSKMQIKSGDTVMVISGADAGKKGKVQKAFRKRAASSSKASISSKNTRSPADRACPAASSSARRPSTPAT